MKNEIIVVTGAGSGLGACLAKKYAQAGAKVLLLGRTQKNLDRVSAEFPEKMVGYQLDVSKKAQVDEVFNQIYSEHGKIDRLINCAGVGTFDLAENIDEAQVDAMIDINLKGTIYTTQAVLPKMKEINDGYIINVISMSGVRANPAESVYCGSKFGVEGFSKAVALELEETNIRVSNFYMGNMATNLWRGDRSEEMPQFISPEDMADIIYVNTLIRNNLVIEEVRVKNFIR